MALPGLVDDNGGCTERDSYQRNDDVAVVERCRMEFDQHLVVGELRKNELLVKLETVKAAATLNRPGFRGSR